MANCKSSAFESRSVWQRTSSASARFDREQLKWHNGISFKFIHILGGVYGCSTTTGDGDIPRLEFIFASLLRNRGETEFFRLSPQARR